MTSERTGQFLLNAEDLPEGAFREAQAERDGQPLWLVLTRQQGTPRAWLNVCPHAGRSLNYAPDRFLVDGEGRLVCAAHGAVFEPLDGKCVGGPCRGDRLRAVPIAEADDGIHLQPEG
ncbi:Rieske (2Fe-2S) protein [Wenzhouxiangella sp. XN79A]|uniref:Rieske (2Fe-2S) protein n=1 Tax=Wenzhouxiangella sp. XN79A TaxID=2724193 RepID=UPI00144AF4E7|nr:Rieske (2Fe-2S) protein [Wenzhouxiangella sp. XN79A]NKI34932.1 Rieske (2Fe-2S) protein [Wenzhouxiangella sp. XN79A]